MILLLFYTIYNESEYVELKRQLTKDIKKEVVAFANTKGGTIYIGIDDNGNVLGLKSANEDLEAISGMIREGIKGDLTLYTNIFIEKINGVDVIIIKVQSAPNKPYYLAEKGMKSSGVYLRHGSSSVPASDEVIRKMLLESVDITFESQVSNNQNLNFKYLNELCEKRNIALTNAKLKSLHIKNNDNLYTNLGLLLSDECPYSIKLAIYNGIDKLEFKDRKEFNGSILKQVNDVFLYMELFNKTRGKIVVLERIDIKDYPEYALRESLLNAIIHRDYNFKGSILISFFDDRYEVVSLGGLIKGINMDDIYMGVSETRNPNLATIFYRLKYVENFGTGIERMFKSYLNYDSEPILQTTENTFSVVLPNVNYVKIDESNVSFDLTQEEIILEYLNKYNKITRNIAQNLLNVSKSRMNEIFNVMVNKNLIVKNGTNKDIYYTLK